MKKFILITAVLSALLFTACQKEPNIIQVDPTPTVEPMVSEVPIASTEPMTTAEAGFTVEPMTSTEPTATASATVTATATPAVGTTAAAKGMLDNVPEFKSNGKFVDKENAEDIGILQVEDVTEQEFQDYIKLLRANGFEGELESANSEMRYGCFTNDTYAINVTFTIQSGYPNEFLLCVSANE